MKKTEVIIYGGAFNPPTIAHVQIVQALINEAKTRSAEVWIMPNGERRDKKIGVDILTRIAYVKAMIDSCNTKDVEVSIDNSELLNSKFTETIASVERQQRDHPNKHFTWVFGSDSVATMHQWRAGKWMYDNLPMLLIDRPGYELGPTPKNATMLRVETPEISSTKVRDSIKNGDSIQEYVSPVVLAVINAHSSSDI